MTWGTDCPQCGKNDCKWVRGSICDGNVEQQFATLQRELEAAREREMQWGSLLKVTERELEAVRKMAKLGEHLTQKAIAFSWDPDGGEGAYEFICRTHYAQGAEDAQGQLEAVLAERDALREAEADARSTLTAWFAERDKLREATTENLMAALNGYLRTSESGGMPGELADAVRGVLADFCRLDGVADLLHEAVRQARAALQRDLEAVRKERDATEPHYERSGRGIVDAVYHLFSHGTFILGEGDALLPIQEAYVRHRAALSRPVQQPTASGRASPVTQAELDDCYGQGLPLPPSGDALRDAGWKLGGARCDQCDNGIEADWYFCAFCGTSITRAAALPPSRDGGVG